MPCFVVFLPAHSIISQNGSCRTLFFHHYLCRSRLRRNESYYEIDQVWFQENLPNPPFYDDDKPGKPVTWFKTETTAHMVEKLQPLMDMMDKYNMPYDVVYTNFVGRIVYEDEYQVAVYDE